ncbi:MAG: hypothetical protein EOP11_12700 [Proteobacteria bacterium]|nr:MAG: hypothetical protein EOP11_12700 [Pseudomonadota bacterium]
MKKSSSAKASSSSALAASIARAEAWVRDRQNEDGSWIGEVELNPGPTAQVVMLHAVLRRPLPPKIAKKALAYLTRTQNTDGGWSPHHGAGSEVSLTCECYVALRLLGTAPAAASLKRARERIEALGGPGKANPWTQLYLAMLGIIPWHLIYRTPVEIMLAPRWLPIQLADLSYWVKAITVPMALLGSLGPAPAISLAGALSEELSVAGADFSHPLSNPLLAPLRALSGSVRQSIPALKKVAIRRAWEMIASFTEAHGDFGGNTCTAMNVLMALYREGREDSPEFKAGYASLMSYAWETEEEWRVQCCQSHVWDTGFALSALTPEKNSPVAKKAITWFKQRQITKVGGDWQRNTKVAPGGWCFGDHHDHFPVTDCTALSLMAAAKHDPAFARSESARLAVNWLLGMQHEAGGWSAYEKYARGKWLNKVIKFKDIENALVDIPKADVSAKVLEALASVRAQHPEVEPALKVGRHFLLNSREPNGLWKGNYGVNYLYGTAFAAKALREIDGAPRADWALATRDFFLKTQNPDGGWGEAEESYRDETKIGKGPSSPVQSAWALLGLCAGYQASAEEKAAIERAVEYFAAEQNEAGIWEEELFTGTVFPGMVYFRYELYPAYFPLMALRASSAALAGA